MKSAEIFKYFITYAIVLPVVFTFGFAFVIFFIVPFVASPLIGHWTWQPINNYAIGTVLLSIPIGIGMAGMLTLMAWYERTDMAVIKKLPISIAISVAIYLSGHQVVLLLNVLYPVPPSSVSTKKIDTDTTPQKSKPANPEQIDPELFKPVSPAQQFGGTQ